MNRGPLEWVLGPVLLLQARRVRRGTPRLPEPPGPRTGVAGRGPDLRVLVAGDSAAAGVGAPAWETGLTAGIVDRLRLRFRVSWRLEAATGATTADTLRRLSSLRGCVVDVLVTSLGVNDLTRGRSLEAWRTEQRALRRLARDHLGARLLVTAGLPPVGRFPALPWPLRWYLGRGARRFTEALEVDLLAESDARFVDLRFGGDSSWMASDGFHPGPRAYAAWADRVAACVETWWDGEGASGPAGGSPPP